MNEDSSEKHKVLSNGFTIPNHIWNKLYKHQKSSLKWLWLLYQKNVGGILADEMGLGKTIQIISFLTSLAYSKLLPNKSICLILCPSTVINHWKKELEIWCPDISVNIFHHNYTLPINFWKEYCNSKPLLKETDSFSYSFLISSYNTFSLNFKKINCLNCHYVILDEGHKIKNFESDISRLIKTIKTRHRLILTGSPVQNNLKELWSLFDFIVPGKLGTYETFNTEINEKIISGGYINASKLQVEMAFKCAKQLQRIIEPFILRRKKIQLNNDLQLKDKFEHVLFCKLTNVQKEMYISITDNPAFQSIKRGDDKNFWSVLNSLKDICNYPEITEELDENNIINSMCNKSGKLSALNVLIDNWNEQKHKCLIFTQSLRMVDILTEFLSLKKISFLKMDGRTPQNQRKKLIDKFVKDHHISIFLLSTKVGGLGLNLSAATRVVIYDPDWNPCTDSQARERVHRIGQKNKVHIYRLLTSGTVEEKIYHRQIFKQFLANKVLENPAHTRLFKSNDLHELFVLGSNHPDTVDIFFESSVQLKPDVKRKKPNNSSSNWFKIDELDENASTSKAIFTKYSKNKITDPKLMIDGQVMNKYVEKMDDLLDESEGTDSQNDLLNDLLTTAGVSHILDHNDVISSKRCDFELECLKQLDENVKNSFKNLKESRNMYKNQRNTDQCEQFISGEDIIKLWTEDRKSVV